jgi:hypothetical protein
VDLLNAEAVFAVVIVILLVGMAGYFAWRQWQTLRRLSQRTELPAEERQFQRAQAWRRLLGSLVMIVLAGLLVGSYWVGQERQATLLGQPDAARGTGVPLDPARQQFLTQYSMFWILFGVLLLVMVFLAFLDMWAIRRFARKQFHRIHTERRAMIERQVAQLRRERNGF